MDEHNGVVPALTRDINRHPVSIRLDSRYDILNYLRGIMIAAMVASYLHSTHPIFVRGVAKYLWLSFHNFIISKKKGL